LAAFKLVIFRTASSSVSSFRSRTYTPSTRGNVPKFRGCGFPCRSGPSTANADPSEPIEHQGCTSATFMSSSVWCAYTAGIEPSSSINRSNSTSRLSGGGDWPAVRRAITRSIVCPSYAQRPLISIRDQSPPTAV